MRSTTGPSGNTYHHNGDFSGHVIMQAEELDSGGKHSVAIPMEDILHLAAAYMRQKAIERVENMSVDEIFAAAIG